MSYVYRFVVITANDRLSICLGCERGLRFLDDCVSCQHIHYTILQYAYNRL